MAPSTNPYESPAVECDTPDAETAEICRPPFGTLLIGWWLLEGGVKAYLVGSAVISGFNPLPLVAEDYRESSLWLFFLISTFFIIEMIGPWVGIYYLTGRRSRTIPFETALYRTLKIAGGFSIGVTFLLMLYCEFVAS